MDIPTDLELTGLWFFPDSPEKKYLGILEYKPFKGKCTLSLYGIAIDVNERIACINGETTTGKKTTLFETSVFYCNKSDNALSTYTVFSFYDFLIGDTFFSAKKQVVFQCLSFQCSNLAGWLGYFPFQSFSRSEMEKGFLFKKKAPITLYSDEKVSIRLQFLVNDASSPLDEVKMKYSPNILIKAKTKEGIPFWGDNNSLSFYMRVVDYFFALVIGRNAYSYNICGAVLKRHRFPSSFKSSTNKKTYLDVSETLVFPNVKQEYEWFEFLHPSRMTLPYSLIKNQLTSFFASFLHHFDSFDYILRDWIMIKNLSSFTNHSLPTLLYNLEGLHESLFPKYRPLGFKNDDNVPYASRLHDIFFNCLDGLFPFISKDQFNQIIKDFILFRKEDAHAKKRKKVPWGYQFNLILLVEFTIYFLILKQTYQLGSNFLNRYALGWDDLQRDLPVFLNERMKSLQ